MFIALSVAVGSSIMLRDAGSKGMSEAKLTSNCPWIMCPAAGDEAEVLVLAPGLEKMCDWGEWNTVEGLGALLGLGTLKVN